MKFFSIATLNKIAGVTSVVAALVVFNSFAKSPDTLLKRFSTQALMKSLIAENADIRVTDDGTIRINMRSKTAYQSGFSFKPKQPWNWQHDQAFAFALNIKNNKDESIHFYVTAKDTRGQTHNRSFAVPAQSDNGYYMLLKGPSLNVNTGIRSDPQAWKTDLTPIIWRHGSKNIDLSNIESITFNVRGVPNDKSIEIKDVRLIAMTEPDPAYLKQLLDKFGQNNKQEFANKVSSVEQLQKLGIDEQSQLRDQPIAGRSKFGGWKKGPKLKASGYFRTEKVNGQWWLVDPEGYLFFSNGIANIRMANTSTITGYDYDAKYIKPRTPGDYTPEDSLGLNPAPASAWPSRYISSKLRADMFVDLPELNDPFSAYYGYRREVHTGAVEKGETYSFYRANLARKYGTHSAEKIDQMWRKNTIDRMLTWGFTSFGNWVDPMFYQSNRLPYFANGWIIGDFKKVSSGNDYWSPLPDPFDPVFAQRAAVTVKQIAAEVKNNPWCIGVFIDNEKSWGKAGQPESEYGVVINTLSYNATESPTKAAFMQYLKSEYLTIEALNTAWDRQFVSWDKLALGVRLTDFNQTMLKDFSALMSLYAEKYFAVVRAQVQRFMPNHLYMGARFADWGMTEEVRRAAAKYADVVSYNFYKESIHDGFWGFLKDLDKASIIGEFHNGALDSGLLNAGLIHAESQADRGAKYQDYLNSVLDNPYLVGAHWFQYIDSPLTGRAYDGENYNVGFVSVTDIPYRPLVEAAKEINTNLYSQRFVKGETHD
ncbi:beta-galactosidase [Gayadomonas joobiniege]|uniref:beta-galactosidase n=1 Tax=Gayadomonas joobiniege TaxID=1234606 RepID=UPI00037FC835|nr:beta-galactosidase [Gayadomonas joobiniege]